MTWNVKDFLAPVPQPYKMWVARAMFPVVIPISLVISALVEGFGWCKEMAGEVASAWRDTRSW